MELRDLFFLKGHENLIDLVEKFDYNISLNNQFSVTGDEFEKLEAQTGVRRFLWTV